MRFLSGLLFCAALARFVFSQTELPPIPADLTTPVQQRLAFNGPMSMRIGWSTFQQLKQPTVYFGQSPHAMFRSATSQSSTTYPTSRTWSNTVTLTMLKPYTTYCASLAPTDERSEPNILLAGQTTRSCQPTPPSGPSRPRALLATTLLSPVRRFFFFLVASAPLINHRQWLAVRRVACRWRIITADSIFGLLSIRHALDHALL
jgi:hypothetical protein